MNRRSFLCGSIAAVLATPLPTESQHMGKVYRIGFVAPAPTGSPATAVQPFLVALRELGWVEGQNIVVEYRWTEGHSDRLAPIMSELIALKVDLIYTPGSNAAAHAARRATSTIPIVFTTPADPVASGLVTNLSRPGANLTGVGGSAPGAKRLELLREALPTIRRVAVLWRSSNPSHRGALKEVEAAALALGLQVQLIEARDPAAFAGAFRTMTKERAEALIVLGDVMFSREVTRIAALGVDHRLPTMFIGRPGAEAGGLLAYGEDRSDVPRRAAVYIDKILKGTKPADLPVEQPTKFELVINLKTARALALTIPPSLLLRADHVIE
jgi:putative ABC transport system substrate-binding protein